MKNTVIKMALVILMIGIFINYYEKKNHVLVESYLNNEITFKSINRYEEVVYKDLTLKELSIKIDKHLNSTLKGYGEYIASLAIDRGVDPVVAASIILLETGCKYSCSALVNNNFNVGGLRGANGWMKFNSLEEGISAFIGNLKVNYYDLGLTTPKLMNKKYASSSSWHVKVDNYVKAIMAS